MVIVSIEWVKSALILITLCFFISHCLGCSTASFRWQSKGYRATGLASQEPRP